MDDVIDFPKSRVKPLSEEEALAYLRREGPIEGISTFAKLVGWERTRTSRMLDQWEQDGAIVRKPVPGGPTVIEAVVATLPAVQGVQTAVRAPPALPVVHTAARAAQPAQADVAPAAPPATGHGVPAWCRWSLSVVSIGLSAALYGASVLLNSTFWPSLATTEDSKDILKVVGFTIESVNYVAPSAIALAPFHVRLGVWGIWSVTMTAGAIAGAGFVRGNFGAAEVSRNQTINERSRLEGFISKPTDPVSDVAVVDARKRVETAKAVAKADCAPVKTKDVDQCNRSRAALGQAETDLRNTDAKHEEDVKAAERRHRDDVANAQAAVKALPATSNDKNVVLAGVAAILPGVSEAWVNGLVAGLWVALFSFGPCMLLRLGLALLRQ